MSRQRHLLPATAQDSPAGDGYSERRNSFRDAARHKCLHGMSRHNEACTCPFYIVNRPYLGGNGVDDDQELVEFQRDIVQPGLSRE